MTRQGKRPFFGIYFAIVLLLLAAYYLYESMGTTMITYAQVQDLFRSEQVESFYVKDGDSLYLSLRGGLLVRNELGSVAAFREDLGELIAEQREQGITSELVALQTKIALGGVSAEELKRIIIAYEPVWAIGTGKTATAEQAAEVCTAIRAAIRSLYGARVARSVTIQYGGSMNPKNAAELLAQPDVDGGLIGGAALKASSFLEIVKAAK